MNKIMGHFVLGYPNIEKSIEIAQIYSETGINYIECQIPFSDPSADGSVITMANHAAANITMDQCLDALAKISTTVNSEIVIMSYISRLYHYGLEKLFTFFKEHKINNIIIPDLPFDEAERIGIAELARNYKVNLIPVISLNTSIERIKLIDQNRFPFYYLVSYFGTTGKKIENYDIIKEKINKIQAFSSKEIAIGFGIRDQEDMKRVFNISTIAVIGSELIRQSENLDNLRQLLVTLNITKKESATAV
jgi:tryptophan synthase alpha chain